MMNYFPKQKKKLKDKFVNSFEEEVDLKSMLDARFEKHLNANQGNFIDIMNDRRRNALDFFNQQVALEKVKEKNNNMKSSYRILTKS